MYDFSFESDGDNTFTFVTSFEIVYEIKFKPTFYLFEDEPILRNNTYEMTVFPANPYKNRRLAYDAAVSPTIAAIFNFFFQQSNHTIIVFICDSSDRKELIRKRKFEGWFSSFNMETYIKQDFELTDAKQISYYISVITLKLNPFHNQIIQKFTSLANDFRQDK